MTPRESGPRLRFIDADAQQVAVPRGLIVQEWIERTGGAERVLDEMVRTFPDSDLWCLWNDAPDRFPDHTVTESWLSRPPLRGRKAAALALMPSTWRRITAPGTYDWILVSSYVFAHHARIPARPDVHSFVYVHTPARYLWAPDLDPRGAHPLVRVAARPLRAVDRARARGGGRSFAANSAFIRERIRRAWDVDARVIHPPVDTSRLQSVPDWTDRLDDGERRLFERLPSSYVLGASRFVTYKRLDAVIAAGAAADVPVVIAGSGPEEARLRYLAEQARVPVHLVISPSDHMLAALLQRATAYVFPPVEDFGIMPVEAMAVGTPAVVNATGGAAESVLHGRTGVHVENADDAREVATAISLAAGLPRAAMAERAREFSAERFRDELRAWIRPAS